MLHSPMPLPPSVTPAWKHMRNKKAQIISSSIRNKTPGKRGSLFAKWGWTGAITEPVLLPAQERCRIKLGGHGSVSGCLAVATQPWVLHPSSCRILLPHPAAPPGPAGCVCAGEWQPSRAEPCRGSGSRSRGLGTATQAGLCVQSSIRRANAIFLSSFHFSSPLITDPTYRLRTERLSP